MQKANRYTSWHDRPWPPDELLLSVWSALPQHTMVTWTTLSVASPHSTSLCFYRQQANLLLLHQLAVFLTEPLLVDLSSRALGKFLVQEEDVLLLRHLELRQLSCPRV